MHLRAHVFKDIMEKGVTRNYNTKVNENLHGPIKNIYEHIGNGKNVDEKVDKSINSFFYTFFLNFLLIDHDYLSAVIGLAVY